MKTALAVLALTATLVAGAPYVSEVEEEQNDPFAELFSLVRVARSPQNEDDVKPAHHREARSPQMPDGMTAPPDGMPAPPDGMPAPPDGMPAPPDGMPAPPDGMPAPPDGMPTPPVPGFLSRSRRSGPPDPSQAAEAAKGMKEEMEGQAKGAAEEGMKNIPAPP